jgi:hypothetical protein
MHTWFIINKQTHQKMRDRIIRGTQLLCFWDEIMSTVMFSDLTSWDPFYISCILSHHHLRHILLFFSFHYFVLCSYVCSRQGNFYPSKQARLFLPNEEILRCRLRLPAHRAQVKQWSHGLPIFDSVCFIDKHPKVSQRNFCSHIYKSNLNRNLTLTCCHAQIRLWQMLDWPVKV